MFYTARFERLHIYMGLQWCVGEGNGIDESSAVVIDESVASVLMIVMLRWFSRELCKHFSLVFGRADWCTRIARIDTLEPSRSIALDDVDESGVVADESGVTVSDAFDENSVTVDESVDLSIFSTVDVDESVDLRIFSTDSRICCIVGSIESCNYGGVIVMNFLEFARKELNNFGQLVINGSCIRVVRRV
jgi:hypothetical protein